MFTSMSSVRASYLVLMLIAVGALFGAGLGVVYGVRGTRGAEADHGVRLSDPDSSAVSSAAESLSSASARLGFEVLQPGVLPRGLELISIDARTPPPDATVGYAVLRFGASSLELSEKYGALEITEFPFQLHHPANDTGERVTLEAGDYEVWKTATAFGTAYTAISTQRSFVLHFIAVPELTDEFALEVILSIR